MVAAGSLFVFLGILGVFLPLLPTTPFLLVAAACYARSSEKLHYRLLNNKLLGKYLRNYVEGNGVPLNAKLFVILILWLSIGSSVLFVVSNPIVKGLLILIAIGVTIHVFLIKTLKNQTWQK